jgi:superfamily II DNA/RNA helicase
MEQPITVPELSSFMEKRVGSSSWTRLTRWYATPASSARSFASSRHESARIFAFTATHSVRALGFVRDANGRDLVHINADDASRNNHTHEHHVVPSASLMPALKALVDRESLSEGHKVMIFFNTSMFAEFAFTYLQAAGCTNVEMKSRWCSNMDMLHTRMGNGAANRSEKEFASCMDCFLLTSKTARGWTFRASRP